MPLPYLFASMYGSRRKLDKLQATLKADSWHCCDICTYIPIYIQKDATLYSLFISGNCSTCFGWYLHPSSGAYINVSTASVICHTVTAICRYRGRVGTGLSVLWVAYAILILQSSATVLPISRSSVASKNPVGSQINLFGICGVSSGPSSFFLCVLDLFPQVPFPQRSIFSLLSGMQYKLSKWQHHSVTPLNFWHQSFIFKFQHTLYVKCE
jgi:hypothetical protein